MILAAGQLVSLRSFADSDDPEKNATTDSAPAGVLVGYQPSSIQVVTGTRIENSGFFGAWFSFIVNTYGNVPCCRLTNRDMDGCSGLPKCADL